jgi:CobQ-like glutamine amidotransferase family enzyme
LLPKNPKIADFLIQQAVIKKYGEFNSKKFDDKIAEQARKIALKLPR